MLSQRLELQAQELETMIVRLSFQGTQKELDEIRKFIELDFNNVLELKGKISRLTYAKFDRI